VSKDRALKHWNLDRFEMLLLATKLYEHSVTTVQVAHVHLVTTSSCSHTAFTIYVCSVSKDRVLKYWDLDRFEMLLEMPGHHAEVWALALSTYGDYIVTGGLAIQLRQVL
jgi:U3 small nucleolar RNA-associated protein 12